MKLILILIITTLQVSASALAQQVSLNFKNASLQEVLISIRKQSGYTFVTNGKDLDKSKPVTLTLKSSNIEEILQALFTNQPFVYQLQNKIIMIELKEPEKKSPITAPANQQKNISGTVTDDKGTPLPGVTVILKEQNNRIAITDADGRFSFPNAPDQGTITVRMLGKEIKELKYKNQTVLNFVLAEVDAALSEVQVIAYGQVTKRFNTSNIGSIKGDDIAKQPVSNPLLALQGRVPGLFIQQVSGNTIGNVNVTVQGPNSLNSGNNPFYVVDGVPYLNNNNNGIEGDLVRLGGNSTMNFINPNDIESIEILKDADATAIYGSRAANGAILITTKRGKPGETKVDLNLQNGWGKISRMYDVLNTDQYIAMRKEGILNDNKTIQPTDYDINGEWDAKRNTNWQKELAGGTAHFNNLSAAISGGTANTQFRAGAGFIRQTTVYPGDFADRKNNVQLSINHHSNDQKFTFNLSANYLQDHNLMPTIDLFQTALKLAPDAPALFNANGSINWAPLSTNPGVYTFDNPAKELLKNYQSNTNNLISNALLGYQILPGLELKATLGYNKLDNDARNFTPITYYRPNATFNPRAANFSNSSVKSWIAEPQLTYNREFTFGHIDALLGSTFQETNTDLLNLSGTGYTSDDQLSDPRAASSITVTNSVLSLYRYSAIFGRVNYRFKNRYLINLVARRDGSSRFGSANQLHSFYSAAGAWIFTEENWLKKLNPVFSFGKLKLSYGTTGNDQIVDYGFLSLYNNINYSVNYQNTTGLQPTGLPNPYLQWEETRKLNIGLDLGFFDNRILLNANYYRNRSSNQLIYNSLPTTTGFPSIYSNLPAKIQNSGIEILIEGQVIKTKDFNWHVSANYTKNENKLLAYPNLNTSSNSDQYVIGQPISLVKKYAFAGVDAQTGRYQFTAADGHLTSTPNFSTDRTVYVTLLPKWYGGLSNAFSYKSFQLDILFQYVNQIKQNRRFLTFFPGFFNTNQPASILDRWQKAGDTKSEGKITTTDLTSYIGANGSDAAYSNANFLRLKNLSISYSIPIELTKKIHISNAKIYASAQNILTVSSYEGDPETGVQSLPPLKMYTLGLQVTF